MMKEKLQNWLENCIEFRKNAVNRKLILILHEPKYLNLSGNTWRKKSKFWNRRVTAFKTNSHCVQEILICEWTGYVTL